MALQKYLDDLKPLILKEISAQCNDIAVLEFSNAQEIADKIYEYTSRGKLLRACFVCFAAESFGKKIDKSVLQTAGAIELAQTALLIHDDIMDNDDFRRNKPSMHKMYEEILVNSSQETKHIALSLAICIGDIALFHLFSYLSDNAKLIKLFSKELSKTALGQAFEINKASQDKEISKEDIYTIIQHKTANYTFYLPLLSGMILADASVKDQDSIMEFSRLAGLLFQIKDDELNYLASNQTGKSAGGDIRENKKTLCRLELLTRCPESKELFGRDNTLEKIQQLYLSSGAKQSINDELVAYKLLAEGIVQKLNIQSEYKILWNELLEYLVNRLY